MNTSADHPHRPPEVWLKRALVLIIVGLLIQLLTVFHITPASFLLFAGAGFGPVALGLVMFGWAAVLRRRALDTHGEHDDAS